MKKKSNPVATIAGATTLFAIYKTTKRMIKLYANDGKRTRTHKRPDTGLNALNIFR